MDLYQTKTDHFS